MEQVNIMKYDELTLMKFADGRVATGGEEFVQSIKNWAELTLRFMRQLEVI